MTNTYTHIATATLSSVTSFTFSNIPQNFSHLRLDFSVGKGEFFASGSVNFLRFNGSDAGQTSYWRTGASPMSQTTWNNLNLGENNSGGVVEIPFYNLADVNKAFWMYGQQTDGSNVLSGTFVAGRADITAAINQIQFLRPDGFSVGSRVSIYGVIS